MGATPLGGSRSRWARVAADLYKTAPSQAALAARCRRTRMSGEQAPDWLALTRSEPCRSSAFGDCRLDAPVILHFADDLAESLIEPSTPEVFCPVP
jgi:hypothetical protein